MNGRTFVASLGAAGVLVGTAAAQKPPPIRSIGPIVRVSTAPLASVSTAIPLSDGRVFVNDVASRRVVLFDSTLSAVQVVADSTSATANAYGARPGALIRYMNDTALFIDPASASMPVLSPAGKIVRVMAMPRPATGAPFQLGGLAGLPGFDAQRRLVAFSPTAPTPRTGPPQRIERTAIPDSAFLVRFDLTTRVFDTVATFKVASPRTRVTRDDDGRLISLEMTIAVLPMVDDWVVTSDGSVAIVRGHDYHVDRLGTDGRWTSSPKMPFEWQHLDDDLKTTLIDSALARAKALRDSLDAAFARNGPPPPPSSVEGGRARAGGGGGGGAGPIGPPPAVSDGRPALSDLPDYRPPFTRGSTRADADGNLWIKTSNVRNGQPVYDVVNRRGELTDRVQIPPFRTIAGFGPGVIYMAVKDSAGVVHLERARVR